MFEQMENKKWKMDNGKCVVELLKHLPILHLLPRGRILHRKAERRDGDPAFSERDAVDMRVGVAEDHRAFEAETAARAFGFFFDVIFLEAAFALARQAH